MKRSQDKTSQTERLARRACRDLEPVGMPHDADGNPALVYLGTLGTAKSRVSMRSHLRGIARIATGDRIPFEAFPWHRLAYRQTQAIRAALAARYEPQGANLRLCALGRVFEEAFALGHMAGDDYHRAARIRNVRGKSRPPGRALCEDELRALVAQARAPGGTKGARAVIAVLIGTAARRDQLTRIRWPDDVDLEAGVLGHRTKGQAHRAATLQPPVVRALEAWLELRGGEPGPLICALHRHGRLRLQESVSADSVYRIVRDAGRAAGLRHVSPHDLRRTFATNLFDHGVDLHVVQDLMGHEKMETTAGYDQRRDERGREATRKLTLPF